MADGAETMIRLVRCPKCRQVLHELPDVPVYQCGGCGTYLQAKIRALTPSASVSGESLVRLPDEDPKSEASDQQEQQEISKEASLPTQVTFLEEEEMSADVGVASQAEFNGDVADEVDAKSEGLLDSRRSRTSDGRTRPYSRNAHSIAEENRRVVPSREEMQYQQKNCCSSYMDMYMVNSRLDRRPVTGRGRLERDECLPQPRGSHFHARIDTSDIEQQKIRLLRMVQELRDQLTRSCSFNDTVSGRRVSAGGAHENQHVPRFRETQHPGIPFSAETTYGRHEVHHCFCCQAQCQKCHNHNRVFCRAHCDATFCSMYGSCSSASPQRHTGSSDYSTYGWRPKSNDHRYRVDHDSNKNYSRETHYSVHKRYIRPATGSFEHGEQRNRTVSNKLKSSGKQHVEAKDTGDPSYIMDKQGNDECTEIGKVRGRGRSPLHRLMGYSTLSGALRSTGTR
ncbi:Protein ENHANCED DISEASE RESISTANCE 4 [Linum grandiflorum]